jgi:hypothetical protein
MRWFSDVVLYLAVRGLNGGCRMDRPRTVQQVRGSDASVLSQAFSLISTKYGDAPILKEITEAYSRLGQTQKIRANWTSASLAFVKGDGDQTLGIFKNAGTHGAYFPPPSRHLLLVSREDSRKSTRELIDAGEGETVEFKQTLRHNVHTGKPDKTLELMVVKTICGFLNANGGSLLVGVRDDRKVTGLAPDGFSSDDKCLRYVADLLATQIGAGFSALLRISLESIEAEQVLRIDCRVSSEPVYHQPEQHGDFYVRFGAETRKLNTQEAVRYVKKRFPRAA